jgi:hypothetical protein
MAEYQQRLVDTELDQLMAGLPAFALEGPRGVGKDRHGPAPSRHGLPPGRTRTAWPPPERAEQVRALIPTSKP